jgi:hypothetical protein
MPSDNNNQRTVHKNHILTTFYPCFSHPISAFIVFQLPKISTDKSKSPPRTTGNSPQLTTNPEDSFYPHQSGPSIAIDLGSPQEYPSAKPRRKLNSWLKEKSPILERMGLKNMPAIT